jgi:hypothetical protein
MVGDACEVTPSVGHKSPHVQCAAIDCLPKCLGEFRQTRPHQQKSPVPRSERGIDSYQRLRTIRTGVVDYSAAVGAGHRCSEPPDSLLARRLARASAAATAEECTEIRHSGSNSREQPAASLGSGSSLADTAIGSSTCQNNPSEAGRTDCRRAADSHISSGWTEALRGNVGTREGSDGFGSSYRSYRWMGCRSTRRRRILPLAAAPSSRPGRRA